jgi:hypothetical protein
VALIIEFSGISCSGKSTALESIFNKTNETSYLNSEAVITARLINSIKLFPYSTKVGSTKIYKIAFLFAVHLINVLKYSQFYFLCMRQILKADNSIKASRSFYFKIGKYFLLKKANEKTILMDEGPVQMLSSLFVQDHDIDKAEEEVLVKIINVMPLPDEIVFGPHQPAMLFVDRILSRGHHRVTGKCHKSGNIRNVIYTDDEVEIRAKYFIRRSIYLQKKIMSFVSKKTSITCLDDIDGWDSIIEKYTLVI